MGFDDHSLHNVPLVPENYMTKPKEELKEDSGASKLSDQEILESTEAIYFAENVDTAMYELKVSIIQDLIKGSPEFPTICDLFILETC